MTIRRTLLAASVLAATIVGKPPVVRAQQPAISVPLVFDSVTVIDVQQGRRIPAQRVVIVGNHIRAMGSASTVRMPAGARVVDARGKYLIPGLWDMHTHSRRYTDMFYPLFIANGVTGIRDAWSEVPLDTILLWRREIVAGTRIGPPRQLIPGPALDEARPCTRDNGGHVCVADSADARHVVDSLKAGGADFIKTYGLGREMYFAIAAEGRRIGIPVGGHLNGGVATAIEAADSGVTILDHINTSGDLGSRCLGSASSVKRCQPVAERFRHDGTWFVPTLIRMATESRRANLAGGQMGRSMLGRRIYGPASRPIVDRFYRFAKAFWAGATNYTTWLRDSASVDSASRAAPRVSPNDSSGLLHVAHQVGLPILAGTDEGAPVMELQPPGFSIHTELATYVTEGLTPLEALQTATLNPARYLHGTDSLGTVAPGKLADVVLLDADPLEDIMNTMTIRAVVANGRYFDRAALNHLLADAQAQAKREPQPLGQARN